MHHRKHNIGVGELYRRFDYNLTTGTLKYRHTVGGNRKGAVAGSLHKNGYRYVVISGYSYLEHRIADAMYSGYWSTTDIDHINGVRNDNRIENLRRCGRKENSKNRKMPKNNTKGIVGVYWHKDEQKWNPQIRVDWKLKNLGYFDDFFEACCARKSAERKYNFHENHGR